jgi:galacturonosyltransferase
VHKGQQISNIGDQHPSTSDKKNSHIVLLANSLKGLYSFRFEVVQRLIDDGYQVSILAPHDEISSKFTQLGCIFIPVPISRRGTNPFHDFLLFRTYLKFLKQIHPGVVLTYTVKPNIYGGIACNILRVPVVANVTGLGDAVENQGLVQKLVIILTKIAFKKTRAVFFQNASNNQFYEHLKLVRPEQSQLLPGSGVNLEKHSYIIYPKDENRIRMVYISRIMKDKGVGELLEAVTKIHSNHLSVTCDIVGPFEDDSYRNLIESYVATETGQYLGVSSDVHTLLCEYHAVVLPSYHEGMSNVLLEAAATGRPVLASNVPGCRETFDEGISGFGFEPRSVDSLVKAIERFIALPHEQKAAMGLAGRKKMEREFDRQIVVDAYIREIENILEEDEKKDKKK